jgi:AcrR family transcriptional regulator
MDVNPLRGNAMNDDRGTGLPASIEAAWGRRGRSTKGPKPGLSLERIVGAAIKIAGAEGLSAVSMSRVAAELGTSAMSLYRYVAAKDELLALMVDAAGGTPPPTHDPDEGWRAGLSRWAWAYRAVLTQNPWALRIPISGPPVTPNQVAWMEDALRSLRDTGLTEAEKLSVLLLLSGYVRNEATLVADIAAAARASGSGVEEVMPRYGRLLRQLTDAGRFPALHRALASDVFDADDEPEVEFVFGLERILDGVEVLVRARTDETGVVQPEGRRRHRHLDAAPS